MWIRSELKSKAKFSLRNYYWTAVLVSLIFSMVSSFGTVNTGADTANVIREDGLSGIGAAGGELWYSGGAGGMMPFSGSDQGLIDQAAPLLLTVFAGVAIVFLIIGLLVGIFLKPVFEVGKNRFYLESRAYNRSAGVGKILWGFSNGYLRIVKTQLLKGLLLTAIMIAGLLPGIVALLFGADVVGVILLGIGLMVSCGASVWCEYAFLMVPYILTENSDMKSMDILKLSVEMMQGNKFAAFLLSLSFFGWLILGAMLCGVGVLFVNPYMEATFAELYMKLREPYVSRMYGSAQGSWNGGSFQEGGYESGYSQGNGYSQESGYGSGSFQGDGYGSTSNSQPGGWAESLGAETPDTEVKRSEGGPGRGYYLNGKFYPYTDEERAENK